ncbi:MAG: hypothetical protein GXN94_04405 [Aquificae bacterium]|nr:hypothetical protein [Aquificota bacterium]
MMEFTKKDGELSIVLKGDFNYPTVKRIENILKLEEIDRLTIDIGSAKVVDSEAVKLLFRLDRDSVQITVLNPPYIFDRILNILKLKDRFKNLKTVKEE